jgi:hypothetical protein
LGLKKERKYTAEEILRSENTRLPLNATPLAEVRKDLLHAELQHGHFCQLFFPVSLIKCLIDVKARRINAGGRSLEGSFDEREPARIGKR